MATNILFMPVPIPIWILSIIVILIITILYWIWRYWDNIKNYCPEASIFKNARSKGIAIMQKHYTNGFFVFEGLEKDKKGDMYQKIPNDSHEGIRFDPRIQSKSPKCSTLRGLEIYQYGSNTPYNLTALNASAMATIINHVRSNYKELDFLTNQIIIEFCQKPKNVLLEDCLNLVSTYNTSANFNIPADTIAAIKASLKEDIIDNMGIETEEKIINKEVEKAFTMHIQKLKAEKLAKVFTKIQDELITMEIKEQYFSFSEAFGNMICSIIATDMQTYKQMIDKLSELKNERFNMNFLITVGFAVMLILIGAGVFYAITSGGSSTPAVIPTGGN